MKKIGIIGQFAPPIHGLSKALDTLFNSNLNVKYDLYKINLTNNNLFFINLFKLLISDFDIYYLTIAQSRGGNFRDLIIVAILLLKKKKIILHLHGGGYKKNLENHFSKFQRLLNYKIFSRVEKGIVLGESLKYNFEGLIPNDKISVVENCADEEFVIDEVAFEEKIQMIKTKNQYQVLYLSNFIEEKGYKEVLKLAKIANKAKNKDVTFIFAGKFFSKEDEAFFFNYIKEYNLSNLVQYLGIIQGREKYRVLSEADIFILLTDYKNEGQPISIIEAAFNGHLIVTTNHAGICDIVDGNTALIYEKESLDLDEVYKDILDSFRDKMELQRKLNENRNKMKKVFSKEKYILKIDQIFNEL